MCESCAEAAAHLGAGEKRSDRLAISAGHANWTREQPRLHIDHVNERFGFNRIMYGGDWPVAELAGTYIDWREVLDWATAGCTAEEKSKLFRDNGIKAYRLNV